MVTIATNPLVLWTFIRKAITWQPSKAGSWRSSPKNEVWFWPWQWHKWNAASKSNGKTGWRVPSCFPRARESKEAVLTCTWRGKTMTSPKWLSCCALIKHNKMLLLRLQIYFQTLKCVTVLQWSSTCSVEQEGRNCRLSLSFGSHEREPCPQLRLSE